MSQIKKPLTEAELELMSIVWRLGEGTVNEILANLPKHRKLAYTSVSTILRILEQKHVVDTRKEGRGHIYFPRLTKAEYEASTLQNVVSKVFDGAPVALVRQLLDNTDLSETDLKEIQKLLNERLDR
jgi:predicted transcriptional regulator